MPLSGRFYTPPSKPFSATEAPDVCFVEHTHPARTVPFRPDGDFYNSECCEGLWVCCSKKVPEKVMAKVCALVRAIFPESLRRLFGEFRPPRWCCDHGPMRLVILHHGERAGMIPEFKGTPQESMQGANQTHCPFAFSHVHDFEDPSPVNWGKLTTHEITHAADMVIRQLVDPYFHEEVELLYRQAEQRATDGTTTWNNRGGDMTDAEVSQKYDESRVRNGLSYDFGGRYRGGLYAMANRDEYLAETHTFALEMAKGMCGEPPLALANAKSAGIVSKSGLQKLDPSLVALLQRHFTLPDGGAGSIFAPWDCPPARIPPTATATATPMPNASCTPSCGWRLSCRTTTSGWAWDIARHRWAGVASQPRISGSGNAGPGYTGASGGMWGGRKHKDLFWLAGTWPTPVAPEGIVIQQGTGHYAAEVALERHLEGGSWETVSRFTLPNAGDGEEIFLQLHIEAQGGNEVGLYESAKTGGPAWGNKKKTRCAIS
eukprot:TRINITY_DN3335_c0_g1_i1.p1 TRINITY_DN3335_c0_g1~~TRINITY_DN3335_c0_g1_i1.p1  ORF type:complete len:488 (+),score=61.43 TRINITY_DN3335_c0_g1_i1:67-1530(+)